MLDSDKSIAYKLITSQSNESRLGLSLFDRLCFCFYLLNFLLQSSPLANGQVQLATGRSKEGAYELAKDFGDEGSQLKKDADPVYTVPTSNRLVNYIENQQILYRVSPWICCLVLIQLVT